MPLTERKEVCKFHSRKQGCKFGDRCRLLHIGSSSAASTTRGNKSQQDRSGSAAGQEHGILLKLTKDPKRLCGNQRMMAQFIQSAYNTVGDTAFVLRLLGSSSSGAGEAYSREPQGGPPPEGLACLAEICKSSYSTQAGAKRDAAVSFQRVIVALLRLITCPALLYSTLDCLRNAVWLRVMDTMELQHITACLREMREKKSIEDEKYTFSDKLRDEGMWCPISWCDIVQPIVAFLRILMTSFRQQYSMRVEAVRSAIQELKMFTDCMSDIQPLASRQEASRLQREVKELIRTQAAYDRQIQHQDVLQDKLREKDKKRNIWLNIFGKKTDREEGDGPGEYRKGGSRHDNDHGNISDILIVPTEDEVMCNLDPFLPANHPGSVPHLPPGTVAAHLDVQFRLLRHDMVGSLCQAVQYFQNQGRGNKKKWVGGRFQVPSISGSGSDVSLFVFCNVTVVDIRIDKNSGTSFLVEFDDIMKSQSRQKRLDFWTKTKRLQHGSLVMISIENKNSNRTAAASTPPADSSALPALIPAVVSHRDDKLLAPQQANQRPRIGISLCHNDGKCVSSMLDLLMADRSAPDLVMLQAPVSFFGNEAVLTALQKMGSLPMQEYLVPTEEPKPPTTTGKVNVDLPQYLIANPQARYNFSALIDKGKLQQQPGAANSMKMQLQSVDLKEPKHDFPTRALQSLTTFDDSQIAALKAALCQRIALIQGPPGTGKTFLGIKTVQVLLENTLMIPLTPGAGLRDNGLMYEVDAPAGSASKPVIGPILCLCYTNHALDQFLEGLLNAGITGIVRVGSRSKSQAVSELSLFNKSKGISSQSQRQLTAECYQRLELAAEQINQSMSTLKKVKTQGIRSLQWNYVKTTILVTTNELYDSMLQGPGAGGETPNEYWKDWAYCNDIDRKITEDKERVKVAKRLRNVNRFQLLGHNESELRGDDDGDNDDEEEDGSGEGSSLMRLAAQFGSVQLSVERQYQEPTSKRPLQELLQCNDAWGMSRNERRRLLEYWSEMILQDVQSGVQLNMRMHNEAFTRLKQVRQDVNLSVLKRSRVVGMTTSGAASMQTLIRAVGFKVVVIEEAAEVLEAHVLASLTPETEHLIMIGDHEQLRPKVDTYKLRMESNRGYNLDMSLFERLVQQCNFPVATLQLQHRMRPQISAIIRDNVYPNLKDHASVSSYPGVKGLRPSVYFLHHTNEEGGVQEETGSKYNVFEAQMSVAIARYLLQQGYSSSDITILTPYLGQLMKLREELRKSKMMVTLSEKDAETLQDMEEIKAEDDATSGDGSGSIGGEDNGGLGLGSKRVSLHEAVRVSTVDNFQGEESTVIILSLVRNNKDNIIGFLKIKNRINVMLSRAKHGMIILGNAVCLTESRHSDIWPNVLQSLDKSGCMGPSLPIVCQNHPETVTHVTGTQDFATFAADGGCTRSCETKLPLCGHKCPRLCHPDDPRHEHVLCLKPCPRLLQPCEHACSRQCGECSVKGCGPCQTKIPSIQLPCGHEARNVPCHRAQTPAALPCTTKLEVHMRYCGHNIMVACHRKSEVQASPHLCTRPCNAVLPCGHTCTDTCGGCIARTARELEVSASDMQTARSVMRRLHHTACRQKCDRQLLCGHHCEGGCHQEGGRECGPCMKKCIIRCVHSRCDEACHRPCAPCAEQCSWKCSHRGACDLPCGVPCDRLPCDKRCSLILSCGHECPFVCGHEGSCPEAALCLRCGDPKSQVHDFIMNEEVSLTSLQDGTVDDNPLVRLPCGHIMFMDSMDGIMELHNYYTKNSAGEWTAAIQIQRAVESLKTCPLCRAPIVGISRYGRPINKQLLDCTTLKYSNESGSEINKYIQQIDKLTGRMAEATDDALERCILDAKKMARELGAMCQQYKRPPTQKAYEAAKASLLRELQYTSVVDPRDAQDYVAARMKLLCMGAPDMRPACNALRECSRVFMILAQGQAKVLSGHASEYNNLKTTDTAAKEVVEKKAANAVRTIEKQCGHAIQLCSEAVQLALSSASWRTQAQALYTQSQHHIKYIHLLAEQRSGTLFQRARGVANYPELASSIKNMQLKEWQAAQQCANNALLGLRKIGSTAVEEQRRAQEWLNSMVEVKSKIIEQAATAAELKSVWEALLSADGRLGTPGYNTRGHVFTCPKGHPYVIGECGGAVEESTCPDCGERVGGSRHALLSGNRVAHEFLDIVQG